MKKPEVYSYDTAVAYLNAFIDYSFYIDPRFSIKSWSQEIGINSERLKEILKNKKALKTGHLEGMQKSLNLDPERFLYLQVLIKLNHAGNDSDRAMYANLKNKLRPANKEEVVITQNSKMHGSYLPLTILSMLKLRGIQCTKDEIFKCLKYESKMEDIQEAINLLEKNKLIAVDSSGKTIRAYEHLNTRSDIKIESVHDYYHDVFNLAKSAIEEDLDKREFQCFSFCLNREDIDLVKKILRQTRDQLISIEKSDADVVYQVNFQAFPIAESRVVESESSHLQQ